MGSFKVKPTADGSDLLEIDAQDVAQQIRSGEYFEEALRWYSAIYHTPLAERCYFVIVVALSGITTTIAILALLALLPLKPGVPFTIVSRDIVNEIPLIQGLAEPGEDANVAVRRYFITNYVTMREGYDVNKLAQSVNSIRSQSEGNVFNAYRNYMNPGNPRSPIGRYERHTTRDIKILGTDIDRADNGYRARVTFEAIEKRAGEQRRTRWVANMNFRYQNLSIDQETFKVSPMAFQVTSYDVKPLAADTQ